MARAGTVKGVLVLLLFWLNAAAAFRPSAGHGGGQGGSRVWAAARGGAGVSTAGRLGSLQLYSALPGSPGELGISSSLDLLWASKTDVLIGLVGAAICF